jgi:hypothetical protein
MAETPAELQRQKEDIQILLSTLEEAYKEASITEEHYKEVRSKNQKKLEEINAKIERLEKEATKKAEKEEKAAKRAEKKGKKPRKAEPAPAAQPAPAETAPATAPAVPAQPAPPTSPAPGPEKAAGGDSTDYSGIPQPLTDIAGETEIIETKPEKAPGAARRGKPGSLQYTADEIKEMFGKILKEMKPQGIEVVPRVDKLEVQLEKVHAYLDSMKDERSTGKENVQRLTEEVGEIRSNLSGLDRRFSESEIKLTEISESLGDMRPQRFLKIMGEEDAAIKLHEARLDKLDDLTSVMLKKLGQIEEVLKRLGSLEKIVNFSREAAKRLLEIENREKRITRIADKIDGIFMELNKRLEEFALYKAKQDTLDELSQEMMKSLDDMNTKIQKYAEKSELDEIKSALETELASVKAGTGAGASPEVQKLQSQKAEIEGLIAMLDEQFKAKALPEKEYQKTKNINLERLREIDKKIEEARLGAAPAPAAQEPGKAASPEQTAKTGQEVTEKPGSETAGTRAKKPHEEKPQEASPEKPSGPKPEKPEPDKQGELLSQLEDSLMKGLIGREAYEKTRKLIRGRKGDKEK